MAAAGAEVPLRDYTRAQYARALMGVAMNRFHETWDLLLTPTMPIPAFAAGHDVPPDGLYREWTDWRPLTYQFNPSQQPAAPVPCALPEAGLPVGLALAGPLLSPAPALRPARAFAHADP